MRRLFLVACMGCSDPTAKPDAGIDSGPLPPSLTISPASFNFGDYELGTGDELPAFAFTVHNFSAADVEIATLAISGTHAMDFPIRDNPCPPVLAPDATCEVTVQFDPTASDLRSAQLDVATSTHLVSAPLRGTAIVRGARLVFTPPRRDKLAGPTTGALTPSLIGASAADFSIVSTTCTTLTTTLQVSASPGGSHSLALSGNGL